MDDDVDADGDDGARHRQPGSPHDENGDVARGRERRWLFWFALVAFAVVLVGAAFGVVAARADDPDDAPLGAGAWALTIGIPAGAALVAAVLAAVFVFWRRRRGSALFARSPLWELPTQKQRRHLVRALRVASTRVVCDRPGDGRGVV